MANTLTSKLSDYVFISKKWQKNKNSHLLKPLPVDKETHKLLNHDPMYYVPHAPYDEYEFLKKLSLKNKKGGVING